MNNLAQEILQRPQVPLTEEQWAQLPSEADVEFFEEHGWYISTPIIPEAAIDAARIGCDRFYQGERDDQMPDIEKYANWTPEDGNKLRNNEFVARQIRDFQDLAFNPVVGAIAARLTRSDSMRMFEEQIIYKPPQNIQHSGAIGWHADFAYCSFCTSTVIAGWIPLHDIEEDMGPLVILEGSHKWEEFRDLKDFQNEDLGSLEEQFMAAGHRIKKVPMTLKKGQMSFHHGHTIHGSYPNRRNHPRIAMAVHLQDGPNQFKEVPNPRGGRFQHYLDPYCRRLPNQYPDLSDPLLYPTVWDEQWHQQAAWAMRQAS